MYGVGFSRGRKREEPHPRCAKPLVVREPASHAMLDINVYEYEDYVAGIYIAVVLCFTFCTLLLFDSVSRYERYY